MIMDNGELSDKLLRLGETNLATNFTLQMLADLEAAIAQGALRVKYSDKEVLYRSIGEMMQVRDLMRKELGITSSQNLSSNPSYSKGL